MAKCLQKLPPKEIENLNYLTTFKDFESIAKTYPLKNSRPLASWKNLTYVLVKLIIILNITPYILWRRYNFDNKT